MSKLVMWNLVTLDGYFEGTKNWDLDWHEYVWGDELERLSIVRTTHRGDDCTGIARLRPGRLTQGVGSAMRIVLIVP